MKVVFIVWWITIKYQSKDFKNLSCALALWIVGVSTGISAQEQEQQNQEQNNSLLFEIYDLDIICLLTSKEVFVFNRIESVHHDIES